MSGLVDVCKQAKDLLIPLLKDCAKVGNFCSHHAEWLREQGVDCDHTRMAIFDSAYTGWRRRWEDMPQNPKPRILLAGHINGIATLSGLFYLSEDILPHMDLSKYDIHICGGEIPRPDLVTRFKNYPSIIWRGFVPDIRKEILQADIFLCPTPITLGLRTRLIEIMSLGGFIIAHTGNSAGMKELVHGENCVMADTGEGIANLIEEYSNNPEERYRMGLKARETYEEYFAPDVAGKFMVEMIEEAVRNNG